MKVVEVCAAVLIHGGKILCMQRPENKHEYISFKYEFPGGKLEEGETREAALSRELREEMEIDLVVKPEDYLMTVEHDYPHFHITMHAFVVEMKDKNFVRKEHVDHVWKERHELLELDWAGADIPIVNRLMEEK